MSICTNTGLVKHCEKALSLPTKYMWGGILRPIEMQYDTLHKLYGNKAGTGYTAERWEELRKLFRKGYYGVDCVGLIKSYIWSGNPDGGTGSPKYDGRTDVNAGTMYSLSKAKGKIGNIPEIPGLIVYSKTHPHVGVYVGNGFTIESTLGSRGDGVVKRKLDGFWEYFFECPFLDYEHTGVPVDKIEKAAREVIAGKWGSGSERKSRLLAAGYDYAAVQARVNELLKR